MKKIYLSFFILFTLFITASAAGGFYVSGSKLKDANGNDFVIRGINNPHVWFNTTAFDALADIAASKVNCVRIVWDTKGSASRLDQIIQKCIDLKMVPMVELHDATGDNSIDSLNKMVDYWLRNDVKALVSKYEKYIMVNIANEYGGNEKTSWDWKEDYKKAITKLRNGGINTILVIDAPGWGQNSNGPLWYGQELIDHDTKHNLLLSIHMYGSWNNAQTIKDKIDEFATKSLPLLVGEFGYNYNNGDNNLGCKVDHKVLMQKCQEKGVGYMAWSWYGNNPANKWLDMTSDWKTLNWWGGEVINGTYGIKNTSNTCSIFSSSAAPIGKTISILANANGKYVCADKYLGTNVPLVANKTSVGTWEKFEVVDAGAGYIALKALSNGNYVSADLNVNSNVPLIANRTKIGSWEKFQWVDAGGGYFGLKAYSNGKYVCADGALGVDVPLLANRTIIGSWEKFKYTSLKSAMLNDIDEAVEASAVSVYPNPSVNGEFFVNYFSDVKSSVLISIYDFAGKLVYREAFSVVELGENILNVNHNLSNGVYIYQITNGVETINGKIVIK